jgi:hypothetical protein
MKQLVPAFVALSLAAPALAAPDIAPAVTRKPAAAPASASPAAGTSRASNPRDYQAALVSAAPAGEDAALDRSVTGVMSHLLAAGRCDMAASLASANARAELATRARQLCSGR